MASIGLFCLKDYGAQLALSNEIGIILTKKKKYPKEG